MLWHNSLPRISAWSLSIIVLTSLSIITEAADRPPAAEVPRKGAFTNEDYSRHIVQLQKRLPHDGFSVVVQKPFVVIGDEPLETVKLRARQTVQWAVDHLKEEYFADDPTDILDVWLFRDADSYMTNTSQLTRRKPNTPYGFYSSADKALFMNIATGGGTLVHEIVHPFMASNFPDCPSWFNEGLASLYEQAGERNGRIIGQTNWRLHGLQSAIQKGTVPSFEALCSTTTREFYERDKGTNYSQARYLCYYLQERGLLQRYYRAFRKNSSVDPSGFKTLQRVLGEEDMDDFKKRWEAEVLKLKFE